MDAARLEIVPARLAHIRQLARDLRLQDRAEIEGAGEQPRHFLFGLYRLSPLRRAALLEGRVIAVWGMAGDMASATGEAWLFTTPGVESISPHLFFRQVKRELAIMLASKDRLITHCSDSYRQSLRFFGLAGFRAGEPFASRFGVLYRELTLERS